MSALLRIVAWLFAVTLVALPVVAVLNGWVGADRWPLAKLRVQGQLHRVPDQLLQQTVLPHARAGYFAVDLQAAQDDIEQLPWVETAKVRKMWPDVLQVSVTEHRPFARWGEDRLLSEKGRLFAIPADLEDAPLPQLDGPEAQTAEVVALYNDSRALFAPVGLDVQRLVMDPRGSWSLLLDNGTEVVIGRDEARSRLGRFVGVLPQLVNQPARIERADLRYTNGFTLSWGTPVAPAKKQTQDRT
jgi:cell division protein FtsQ